MANTAEDGRGGQDYRPIPDPTVLTTQQLYQAINALKELLDARISSLEKAVTLLQAHVDQGSDAVKEEVDHLRLLHGEKFDGFAQVSNERFGGIDKQFAERDKRTEQLSLADKTAIAAALQAQKEAAGATSESNSVALIKMEANFSKLIDQTQTLLHSMGRNLEDKINDVKSRLDRGEGHGKGLSDGWGYIVGAIGALAGLAGVVGFLVSK